MKKTTSRYIGAALLLLFAAFAVFALGHPEASFPWNNAVTYCLYGMGLAAVVIFLIAPFGKK